MLTKVSDWPEQNIPKFPYELKKKNNTTSGQKFKPGSVIPANFGVEVILSTKPDSPGKQSKIFLPTPNMDEMVFEEHFKHSALKVAQEQRKLPVWDYCLTTRP